jgi:hypothetical protein
LTRSLTRSSGSLMPSRTRPCGPARSRAIGGVSRVHSGARAGSAARSGSRPGIEQARHDAADRSSAFFSVAAVSMRGSSG